MLDRAAKTNGAGLRILTETVTSPTLGAQIQQLLRALPGDEVAQWEPVEPRQRARRRADSRSAAMSNAVYHFDKADVIVSLDADFLGAGPGHLRYARDFAVAPRRAQGRRRR